MNTPAPSRGFLLGSILGIPIRIDPSWFFIFLLITWILSQWFFPSGAPNQPVWAYWMSGLVASLLFFGSVLLHELSHSLVARALRIQVLGITLFLFGGVSTLARDPDDAWKEIKIAAAGPLASFMLGGVFLAVSVAEPVRGLSSPLPGAILLYMAGANLILGLFNLVPGFPLDGGRVLRATVWLHTGSILRATRVASFSGRVVAILLMCLGAAQVFLGGGIQGLWLVLIGLFLHRAAVATYQDLRARRMLEQIPLAHVLEELGPTVPAGITLESAAHEHFLPSGLDALPVGDAEHPAGMLELRRLREISRDRWRETTVEAVLTPRADIPVVSWGADLGVALMAMTSSGSDFVLVQDDVGALRGRVTREAVARFLHNRQALIGDAS